MLSRNDPDRIKIAFDDHRLVANAGLLLPVTLAHHLGLGQLVDHHVDLGDAPGRANGGDKLLTLVASALAGGDCIDDADALRAGGTEQALGCVVKAPSTLGTFLRSFRWGHVRQLDRVSREFLARAWAAEAGPGDDPLTIDLDSTVCETFGCQGRRKTVPLGLSSSSKKVPINCPAIMSHYGECDIDPERAKQTSGSQQPGRRANDLGPGSRTDGSNFPPRSAYPGGLS